MRLYLARHGEAKSEWEDALRPLTDNGKKHVRRIAEFAKGKGVEFDRILHSGKTRAEQTARIFSEVFGEQIPMEIGSGLKPDDNILYWVEKVEHQRENLLIVGHLPFLDYFASMLLTGTPNPRIVGFHPGTLASLEMNEETHQWSLVSVFHSETNL